MQDIIKERLQIQIGEKKLYNGPVDAVKKIVAQNGIKGLYKVRAFSTPFLARTNRSHEGLLGVFGTLGSLRWHVSCLIW